MKKQLHLYLCLLTLMLMAGAQRVAADNNQPRFVIPAIDLSGDDGAKGNAAITAGNPYFTIYMWDWNEDGDDTGWSIKPTITINGHSVKLDGMNGSKSEWTCTENGVTYYYIHAHASASAIAW